MSLRRTLRSAFGPTFGNLALCWLLVIGAVVCGADLLSRPSSEVSVREAPDARPSRDHWLGTDAISRDRYSRLIHGTRISMLLAPIAALLATGLAGGFGSICAFGPPWLDRALMSGCELFIALPWLFVLISLRSALPLNTHPATSVAITFLLLGILGWPGPARVVRAAVRKLIESDQLIHARASGIAPSRIFFVHVLLSLRPVLFAQFWIAIPVFILSEVNLSLIGLGVADPLPSWGALLRDFERPEMILSNPEILVPLVVLVLTLLAAQTVMQRQSKTNSETI